MKPFFAISSLYLPFVFLVFATTGHLSHLGDPNLFFSSWTDGPDYKAVSDYYTSLGSAEKPSEYLLSLRTFVFPMYLGLYNVVGIAGMQILQLALNAASLSLL